MRVNLVLPPSPLDAKAVARGIAWLNKRFRIEAPQLLAPSQGLPHYRALAGIPAAQLYSPDAARDCDVLVFAKGTALPELADDPKTISGPRVYTLEKDGRLRLCADSIDVTESPALDQHVFNRVGPKSPDGEFYYFPYGYLFKYTGLGPINEFGFRVVGDFMRYAERAPDHKLIVVFGGSAAWSMLSLHEEMFATRLEEKLNAWAQASGRSETFTVLNFGMHGHVVLNEILTHVLFTSRIRPDIVIAHDGFNDLVYGMLSDPELLGRHDITYQYNLEDWGQILHKMQHVPTNQPEKPLVIHNIPQLIAKAYATRKQQFRTMVQSAGGRFIWGLQPKLLSKAAMSPSESAYLKAIRPDNPVVHAFKRIGYLYDKFLDLVQLPEGTEYVDLHKYFGRFGADECLFGDMAHTLPDGDERIAECYFDYLTATMTRGAAHAQ
jgi:hypothetical protein